VAWRVSTKPHRQSEVLAGRRRTRTHLFLSLTLRGASPGSTSIRTLRRSPFSLKCGTRPDMARRVPCARRVFQSRAVLAYNRAGWFGAAEWRSGATRRSSPRKAMKTVLAAVDGRFDRRPGENALRSARTNLMAPSQGRKDAEHKSGGPHSPASTSSPFEPSVLR